VGWILERMIKTVKSSLKTIGQATLTQEELCTVVVEIKAVVNLRPLTPKMIKKDHPLKHGTEHNINTFEKYSCNVTYRSK